MSGHGCGQTPTSSVRVCVLLAVDDDGRALGPGEATPVLDLLDQVDQILRFLRQLAVPPLQELEVLHFLARFRLLIRAWLRC